MIVVSKRVLDNNPTWENWKFTPLLLGSGLIILGIQIQILEIIRIYDGLYNNGIIGLNISTFYLL